MKRSVTFRWLLLFAWPVFSAVPAIFVSPVEVTGLNHAFTVTADPEFPNTGGEIFQFSPVSFTADLDTDTEIAYTFRAPEGYKFQLGPSRGYLHLDMTFGNFSGQAGSPATIRLNLENASGIPPVFGGATLVFIPNEVRIYSSAVGNGNEFIRFSGADPGFTGPLEFTGMIFTVTYGERSTGLGPRVFNYQEGGLGTTYFSSSDTDPGPVIQLVPIPEPATITAGAATALGIFAAARAFRKQKGNGTQI